jgi:hypothetical protein
VTVFVFNISLLIYVVRRPTVWLSGTLIVYTV